MTDENYILTIAGFDPTNGAGLTSDLKTFQAHGLYGLSVCTAVTVQNTSEFNTSHWLETEVILDQIKILFKEFKIDVVKIGIVQNWEVLSLIIKELKKPIIAVCKSGGRSQSATDFLSQHGLDVINGGPWQNVAKYIN